MTSQQALAKYNEYSEQYNKVNAVMENLVCIKGALTGASPFFEQAYIILVVRESMLPKL